MLDCHANINAAIMPPGAGTMPFRCLCPYLAFFKLICQNITATGCRAKNKVVAPELPSAVFAETAFRTAIRYLCTNTPSHLQRKCLWYRWCLRVVQEILTEHIIMNNWDAASLLNKHYLHTLNISIIIAKQHPHELIAASHAGKKTENETTKRLVALQSLINHAAFRSPGAGGV